jgi:hypothetical protein
MGERKNMYQDVMKRQRKWMRKSISWQKNWLNQIQSNVSQLKRFSGKEQNIGMIYYRKEGISGNLVLSDFTVNVLINLRINKKTAIHFDGGFNLN